ncbi:ATPase [Bacteroidia bacterium]|nr:ATPase [Bacteroidia bacterium]GHT02663.1 ATPase [Bacteroidia bacterium]GHT45790.1 ATPase [Bacteroidia bacterium]
MKQAVVNPFLLTGYEGPEYFCDRKLETQKITEALTNGRNITLISPRRIGKTGLIHHVFHTLEEQQDSSCFYLDIYHTHSLHDFVQVFAETVIGSLDTKSQKFDKTEESLKEIFAYLVDSGKVCYIAMDEFQQITNYPEKGVEALLRSYIQQLTSVHFIFSGSQKHVMETLFTSASRPFYQSTQMLQLKEIDLTDYQSFVLKLFEKGKKAITTGAIDWAYQIVHGHTWYVQVLFNRAYSLRDTLVDVIQVENVLTEILEENEVTYLTYCNLVTGKQLALLKAIAKEGQVTEPTASSFIREHNLGAASTVSTSLKSLLAKELLFNNKGNYFIYDRFFSLWLKKI